MCAGSTVLGTWNLELDSSSSGQAEVNSSLKLLWCSVRSSCRYCGGEGAIDVIDISMAAGAVRIITSQPITMGGIIIQAN